MEGIGMNLHPIGTIVYIIKDAEFAGKLCKITAHQLHSKTHPYILEGLYEKLNTLAGGRYGARISDIELHELYDSPLYKALE